MSLSSLVFREKQSYDVFQVLKRRTRAIISFLKSQRSLNTRKNSRTVRPPPGVFVLVSIYIYVYTPRSVHIYMYIYIFFRGGSQVTTSSARNRVSKVDPKSRIQYCCEILLHDGKLIRAGSEPEAGF